MKKLSTKRVFAALLILFFAVSTIGLSTIDASDKKQASSIKVEGALKKYTFKVGTSGTYAPFSYYDKDGKTLIGFDMDFLHELQKILGFKIADKKVQAMDYSPLTTSVAQGKLDIAMAALCATDQRKKVMNFSNTYYNAGLTVIVNKKISPKGIKGLNNIKSGKYKIGVQKGDASHLYLNSLSVPASSLEVQDSIATVFESLEQGKIDCMVFDAPGTAYYISHKKGTKLAMIGKQFAQDQAPYAIALSFDACKKNPKLLKIINAAVKELRDNGTMAKIEKKWCK